MGWYDGDMDFVVRRAEVGDMSVVQAQLGLKVVPRPDDAADACAVALTHMFVGDLGK